MTDPNNTPDAVTDLRSRFSCIIMAAIIMGFALRLLCLGSKSIWLDESLSIRAAQLDFNTFASGTVERYHPPLYFLLLNQWMHLGMSEAHLRLPAAVAGGLAVVFVYTLSRAIFSSAVARSAVWFAAVTPIFVWYSQEIRGYSLLVMWTLLALTALAQFIRKPDTHWWLLFTVAVTAGLYTSYTFVFSVPLQILLVAGLLAPDCRAGPRSSLHALFYVLGGWVAAGLMFVPWLRTPAAGAFMEQLRSDRLYYHALTAGRAIVPARLENMLTLNYTQVLSVLLLCGLVLLGGAAALVHRLVARHSTDLDKLRNHHVVRGLFLTLFIFVLIVSVVPRGYTLKRYTIVLWLIFPILFGWIWPWCAHNRAILILLLTLSLVASLANVLLIPKAQWRQTAQLVLASQEPDDVVLLSPGYMSLPFDFYARQRAKLTGVPSGQEVTTKLEQLAQEHGRIWFVYHRTDLDARRAAVEQWLRQQTDLIQSTTFYHIQVDLYQVN